MAILQGSIAINGQGAVSIAPSVLQAGSVAIAGSGSVVTHETKMGPSSAYTGYLRQIDTPLSAHAWTDAITAAVVGITGLDTGLVRPRWQPTPPNQPEADVDWCAVGITVRRPIDYTAQKLTDNGLVQTRWFALTALASFYGPNCEVYAEQLRDGLAITQNLDQLAQSGIKLTEVEEATVVPDLMNVQWIDRVDLPIQLAAVLTRTYNILDVLSSGGTIFADDGTSSTWNAHQ